MVWYDGGRLPPTAVHAALGLSRRRLRRRDCLLIGSEGALLFDHIGHLELIGGADETALHDVPETIPRVVNDATEWIDAIRGAGPPPLSRFEISGPFTRLVLAGNAAIQAGQPLSPGPELIS